MDKYTILKEFFGHDGFRSGQEELIDNILAGRDVLGIMPTGAGKSVCYQVPAMLMDGITIVISPLISLMKDQVSALVSSGVNAAYINSSLTLPQYREVFRRACSGLYKIIYVAPERLNTEEFLAFAESVKISMITVDEAHCVSQWGQDFRPSYLKILEFVGHLSYRPILSAFTATATSEVRDDIISILKLKDPFVITTGFDRKNLYFGVIKPNNKYLKLKELLAGYKGKCGIIYCISRRKVEEVCEKLNYDGYNATRYHAGLTDAERRENQDDFIYDRKQIMVATNAFGMGIDKSNVSYVIHYNMPKNLESYYQEAGRAGRDGGQADCILLYGASDVRTNKFLIESSRETNSELSEDVLEEIIQKDYERLRDMNFYCTTAECLREYILRYFGEKTSNYCANCSNCIGNFETVDITVDAQKIISCVYRIRQKGISYGKTMITDVLKGSKNERVLSLGFDALSTYGIMSDYSAQKIRRIMDFLIDNGYLILTDEEFPTVRLSAASAEILKGGKILLMKLPIESRSENKKKTEDSYYADSVLFQKLRELRNSIASKERVPAYIVFADAALKDMCRKLPVNTAEFLNVSGVGKAKAEKYGEEFCRLIAEYTAENPDEQKAPPGEMSYIEKELSSFRDWAVGGSSVSSFKQWTKDEELQLRKEISSGMNMAQIASAHERTISDITLRIKKL
ncbi:MAG: DNA helicase RecQ [Ruminococcus sp.]|nr:DNA helicase RecQ [Ruminococcus sp.]